MKCLFFFTQRGGVWRIGSEFLGLKKRKKKKEKKKRKKSLC